MLRIGKSDFVASLPVVIALTHFAALLEQTDHSLVATTVPNAAEFLRLNNLQHLLFIIGRRRLT